MGTFNVERNSVGTSRVLEAANETQQVRKARGEKAFGCQELLQSQQKHTVSKPECTHFVKGCFGDWNHFELLVVHFIFILVLDPKGRLQPKLDMFVIFVFYRYHAHFFFGLLVPSGVFVGLFVL